ncbi:Histidine kinase-, DNA gyrase B-, and HSP90-like ATPase [Chitinophaga sp. YR627]|uniref:ATP-binding protein n=1 Tax=Chitinophaga sp. YR627 TaxID=1881041 RepID=UPI0008EB5D52|nr:ATP-binding protein [Chitinophaga sp. YR627]SFO86461.1 Histidine kinase-, DNA gyrase B-, and HSP90-like ATPase [Chitinophaga sp. YR627]
MDLQTQHYDVVRPDPESLLQSARSFGYSIETAIADLIDNSITAKSSKIQISYGIDLYSSFVRIEDNGTGMNEAGLLKAMKVGSFNPLAKRNEEDLGRFGLGLKTASFSQCRRLTVKTRDKSGKEFIRCWDLDLVAKEKDWVLLRTCADKNSENNIGKFAEPGSGTIILWEKLDRLVESLDSNADKEHFYRKFDNVRKHLGLVFHRYIESSAISISILGNELEPINPFNISKKFPSTELAEEQLSINEQHIQIQPYILPHESKLLDRDHKNVEIIRGWTEHQGIFLYRNKRLISDGTWLDLDFKKKDSQRLCRIRIDIPNTLDQEWQIDVKKASAKIPDIIRKRVKNICLTSIDKAIKVYTHRGAYIRRKGEKKEITYLWMAKQKQGKKYYELNKAHPIYQLINEYLDENAYVFNDYMKLIGETLPVNIIVSDFADPSTVMKDFFEDSKDDLKKIYQNMLNALTDAGIPEIEAREKVNGLECFQQLNSI